MKIYELTPQVEEQLDRFMEVEEFRGLVQMLESGGAAGGLPAAIRDELNVYR